MFVALDGCLSKTVKKNKRIFHLDRHDHYHIITWNRKFSDTGRLRIVSVSSIFFVSTDTTVSKPELILPVGSRGQKPFTLHASS